MIGIGVAAEADDLGINARPSSHGVLKLLQDKQPCAFGNDKAVRSLSKGRLARCGSSFLVESARMEQKPRWPAG